MAEWRLRGLGTFPHEFHAALLQGEGSEKFLGRAWTERGAKAIQNQFRLFRYCVRHYHTGELFQHETSLYHRTRRKFDSRSRAWEVLLTSKPSALSELKNPEILDENI